ncbi:MAG: guanylate kinase [Coriobacteriales bacterium]|jgi:guanylate kinase|nr:guanylate kinase [Coriobacteriales bacterium]
MRSGTLFIISGPSGAGKGTLVSRVLASVEGLQLSISATTRPPRAGERDGREYYFFSEKHFDELVAQDGFLEWAEVHGNRYGTPRAQAEQLLARGADLILEIDVQGREQIVARWPEAVSIFVAPPSLDELERRLRHRGCEDEPAIQRRLGNARSEMEKAELYDHRVINDNLQRAADELEKIIRSYRPDAQGLRSGAF